MNATWGKLEEKWAKELKVREDFVITQEMLKCCDLLSYGKQEGAGEEKGKPESCFLTCDRQLLKQKATGFKSQGYHLQICQRSKGGSVFPTAATLLRGQV